MSGDDRDVLHGPEYTFAMVMTVDIPDILVNEANTRGIAVEDLLREKFAETAPPANAGTEAGEDALSGFTRFGPGTKTPAEAAASMREMRKRYTLGGTVTIKQLIEEGRRY